MKSFFVAALGMGSISVAYADTAFQCNTAQGAHLVVSFSESAPRFPAILVRGAYQTRFVKGASYFTNVNLDDEVRTYKFDFGGGNNLVLNFLVSYNEQFASTELDSETIPPAVSGLLDRVPFDCVKSTVVVDYPMLDRIVNNH